MIICGSSCTDGSVPLNSGVRAVMGKKMTGSFIDLSKKAERQL